MVSAVFVRVAAPRTKISLHSLLKDLFAFFVDLEKTFDRVPRDKLRKVLQEYGAMALLF